MTDPDVPQWYSDALAQRPSRHRIEVDGAEIRYRRWGGGAQPGVVFIHGAMAHSGWWDHIAPFFARDRTVVALDLSGLGDSDRRERYDVPTWAGEVMAVAADAGLSRPIVVGHSMGGFVALTAAMRHGTQLSGAMVIDSIIGEGVPPNTESRPPWAGGQLRTYATKEEAMGRFRLVPAPPSVPSYVLQHIVADSLRENENGWIWKFDPAIFARVGLTPADGSPASCRVVLMPAEHGLVGRAGCAAVAASLGASGTVVELPDATHHVMLDQPIALIAALRAVIAEWERVVG